MRNKGLAALAAMTVLALGNARAEVIDLTTRGSSGTSQGAVFHQADPQPTGTGVIDPFVRIQQRGTERGYNTDARPVEFETKDENHWTHSLQLGSLVPVTLPGSTTPYYQFLLDVNEMGNPAGRLLSLNDVELYLGNAPDLTGYSEATGFGANAIKVYDLDRLVETTIELDYKLNSGSGSGDMFAFIPVALFQGHPDTFQYVYLYSAFGNPNTSDAGFEEWAARVTEISDVPTAVPEPSTIALALLGLGGLGLGRLRRWRRAPRSA